MERMKEWMSLEEREDYRKKNYWEKDGIPFNPKKFVRKNEAERIINALAFEASEDLKQNEDFRKYVENVKIELDNLETLDKEVKRRKDD